MPQRIELLYKWFPGTKPPFLCSAPMFGHANAKLATTVTQAGGFGFIGGGFDFSEGSQQLSTLSSELSLSRELLGVSSQESVLPIGIGFIIFRSEGFAENLIPILVQHRPAAVWLFAPASPLDQTKIISALKSAGDSWGLKVFVQVGNIKAAREAIDDGTDILVVQGTDGGGHQFLEGSGLMTLLPEVADMVNEHYGGREIPLLAAGGIMDGRSATAAKALGADGVVMGTRFVASAESSAPPAYNATIVDTSDGARSTVSTRVHDELSGRGVWPAPYSGRAIIGDSYKDSMAGMPLEENLAKNKSTNRTIVWAGSGIGLVKSVLPAQEIVLKTQRETEEVIKNLKG